MVADSARSLVPTSLPNAHLPLGLIAMGVYFLLLGTAQDALYDLIGLSSVVAILVGVQRYHPRHTLTGYSLATQATFVAIGVTYNVYENMLRIPAPSPSLADAFYSVSYLVFVAGLVLLVRAHDPETGLASLVAAVIVPIGVEGGRV